MVDWRNLFVIPGTEAGLAAIEEVIATWSDALGPLLFVVCSATV